MLKKGNQVTNPKLQKIITALHITFFSKRSVDDGANNEIVSEIQDKAGIKDETDTVEELKILLDKAMKKVGYIFFL